MSSSGKTLGALEMVAGAIMMYEGAAGSSLYEMGASMFFSGAFTELSLMLQPSPATAGQDGIIRSSVANQQIVYGQIKTGGVLTFANAYGSNGNNSNAFLTCCISHSLTRQNSAGTGGMPIKGIQGMYINDVFVPVNSGSGGWNSGRGSASGTGACAFIAGGSGEPWNPLAGNLWMSFSDGSQTTPDAILTTNFATLPANFIGFGIAYSTWVLFMSADQPTFTAAFPSGINTPSTLGVVMAGQLLYDPRLDSNNGGTGTQRLNDTTTWVYSSNPALVLADYLTRSKNDGGCGYAAGTYSGGSVINSQVNWAAVAAAANICDENVTVPQYGATWNGSAWSATETVSRYSCNMAVQTNRNCDANVVDILKTMSGFVTVSGGQIYMYAGAETTSSGPLDETFLAGAAGFSPQIQRGQTYNAVKMTYGQEPQQDYNQAQGVAIVNNSYETEDGGVRLWFSDTIPGCNNQFQCQILERIKSQCSRNKQILNLICNLKALNYQAGDVVDVSISELGLTNAPFRIMQYAMGANYTVKMMLLQENANSFVLPATPDAVYQPYTTPNYQTLYNLTPSAPGIPSGLTVSAMTTGNLLQWTPPAPNTYDYQNVYRTDIGAIAKVVGNSFLDADTTAGVLYTYYLDAVNYWGKSSGNSSSVNVTSAQTLPAVNESAVTGSQDNFIPDTNLRFGYNYYPPSLDFSSGKWTISPLPGSNANAFVIPAGTYSGSVYRYSLWFNLQPGTYTLSVVGNGSSNFTAGYGFAAIYSYIVGSGLGTQMAAVSFGVGQHSDGRYSATFTVGSAAHFVYAIDTVSPTLSGKFYLGTPQLEAGSVMTGYRQSADSSGYALYQGSVPPTIPAGGFSYTSTTSAIDWSWTAFNVYQTDGTNFSVNSGTQNYTGLTANTTYYFYPYYNLQSSQVAWGGFGTSKNAAYMAAIQVAFCVPLCTSGVAASTTSSGGGGGSGGGNRCLHPDTQVLCKPGFAYDASAAEKTLLASELKAGDGVLTPDGWKALRKVELKNQLDWVHVRCDSDDFIVTPSHILMRADGENVKAKELRLGDLLRGDGKLAVVLGLSALRDANETVVTDVPEHWLYLRAGGALHHNGTVKP